MQTTFDIAIIGGGLVGASLAVMLADTDLSVVIIEAHAEQAIDEQDLNARSIVLADASKKIFTTLGLWQDLAKFATAINTIHISDKGHFGITRINAAEQNLPAMGYAIQAQVIAKFLYQKIDQAKNITWLRPAKVTQIADKQLTVSDQTIEAALIIAADGGNSQTRKLLNIDSETTDYNQSAVVANVECSLDNQGTAFERFTTTGPIALLPIAEKRMTAVWTMPHQQAKEVAEYNEVDYLQALQQAFGYRVGEFTKAYQRFYYPLNLTVSHEQLRDGILILGNAAHAVHPVSAQGFNLSLRDVAQLAETLLAVDKSAIAEQQVLSQYLQQRQADQQATIQYTDDLVSIFSTDAFPVTPLRSFALHSLNNVPWLKKFIARRASGYRGQASKLLRGIALK